MRFYTKTHTHYCGIDLHARTLYLCILDRDGQILLHKNIKSNPMAFLKAVEPYREELVVAVECVFTWYWLADLCRKEGIEFLLGDALYMKAIHGAKAKNDKLDALKIAALLRGGNLPLAYVYPPEMRATRDLLRRRLHRVRRRANLLGHIRNTHHQYNLPEPQTKLVYKANRAGVAEVFADRDVRKSMELDFALIEQYDDAIRDVQLHLERRAKEHDPQTYYRLRSVPGIGKILALTILYEIHDIRRFPTVQDFLSLRQARQVRPPLGHQKARNRGSQDGQRASEVGVLRGGVPVPERQPPSSVSSPQAGRQARQVEGAVHPGGQAGPDGVFHAESRASFRDESILRRRAAKGLRKTRGSRSGAG